MTIKDLAKDQLRDCMFPYHQRPISRPKTSLDIEKYGYQSLLRALNIGRVVGFIGSGTSLKFGQPTWKEFSNRAAQLFFDLENALLLSSAWSVQEAGSPDDTRTDFQKDFNFELTPLVREIKELYDGKGIEASHFVELCEDYFREVETLLSKHKVFTDEDSTPWNLSAEERKNRLDSDKDAEWKKRRSQLGLEVYAKPRKHKPDEVAAFETGPTQDAKLIQVCSNIVAFRSAYAEQYKSVVEGQGVETRKLRAGDEFTVLVGDPLLKDPTYGAQIREFCSALDKEGSAIENLDASRALRTELGIRRFLTLNYDLELERMLFEEGRATPKSAHDFFQTFVDHKQTTQPDNEIGRAVSLVSPSGRVLRSTSSRPETLADLFSFGAFPTNYDASVHHLHGRVDDPQNMIATPRDYQRVYYGESAQRRSFDEARHAVFTGSDLLVLGMGTSEEPVLKPLRDFLEIEDEPRDTHGRVYYVTSTSLNGEASLIDAFVAARRACMKQTQELYKDYGMHALYVDHSFDVATTLGWTNEQANLFCARAEVTYYLNSIKTKRIYFRTWDRTTLERDFQEVFGDVGKKPKKEEYQAVWGPSTPLGHLELETNVRPEIELARLVAKVWISNEQNHELKEICVKTLEALASRLLDTGLKNFVFELRSKREEWWEAWSTPPGMRLAILGEHRYKMTSREDATAFSLQEKPISETDCYVWRQTNLCTIFTDHQLELGSLEKTPQFSELIRITAEAKKAAVAGGMVQLSKRNEEAKKPARMKHSAAVARVSIPPGGGKGRLVSYFTSLQNIGVDGEEKIYPFKALFNDKLTSPEIDGVRGALKKPRSKVRRDRSTYMACFATHLTFVVEFSSCIVGFARLIQQVLPNLRDQSGRHRDRPEWKNFIGHNFHKPQGAEPVIKVLSDLFEFLKEVCPRSGWRTRVLAIFSYLDRLVDDNGNAHSPIHRSFFRLISGWAEPDTHRRLPFDTLLINSHAEKPIRYLSEEIALSINDQDRRSAPWNEGNWLLQKDRGVALRHWNELKRVRPAIVFKEALMHSAYASLRNRKGEEFDPQTSLAKAISESTEVWKWLDPDHDFNEDRTDPNSFVNLPPNLHGFMNRSVAHGHFLAGLAYAIKSKVGNEDAFCKEWKTNIAALNIAFTRERTRGFLEELLSVYRRLDRDGGQHAHDIGGDLRRVKISTKGVNLERLRTMLVDHMALFNHPLAIDTLANCPDIADVLKDLESEREAREQLLLKELNRLVQRGLAARYLKYASLLNGFTDSRAADTNGQNFVYALDTRLASVLRARSSLEVFSNYRVAAFQPSLYPSQPERALKPEAVHFNRVSKVVRALVKSSHDELVQRWWSIAENQGDSSSEWFEEHEKFARDIERYNDKLRSAYALVRGTFSISVIARLSETSSKELSKLPFDEYRTWTRKLLNCSILIKAITDKYRTAKRPHAVVPFNQPFLRDEISWLYNERALVSFFQGRLFDALPLFEQSKTVLGRSTSRSDPPSFKATHRRVALNHILAQMERGNITTARDSLETIWKETASRWSGDTPSVVHCMAGGYLGLCYHLSNEFTRAKTHYQQVLSSIQQFDHPRAESIFHRHFADLLRSMSKSRNDPEFKEAIEHLRLSEELALGIRATDLHQYALIAEARLDRDMNNRVRALERLRMVEDYARRMGVQKMLAEVLKVRGETLLAEGETVQAGSVTAQSIAISKRNGMRLRKISAAVVQAKILKRRGQVKDCRRLLNEIIVEAQTLSYATKTGQAIELMSDFLDPL